MSNAPCYDECDNAVRQVEFFSSPEDTCKSGSKFLQAYSSCAQCAIKLEAQTIELQPTNLYPVLRYCRMEIGYQTSISTTLITTTDNLIVTKTIHYFSITNLPTEPTASITGRPPTTIITTATSAVLSTASITDGLPAQTLTTPSILNVSQATRAAVSGSISANSSLTWVIGPALGFVALLAIILLLWLYFRPRKQRETKDPDSDWIIKQPPSKTRLPLKSAMKPIRRSPSSLRRFFHIYELPGSALPHEMPGSTSMPNELRGSSPPPKSTRNLHGKGPDDVEVLEAAYVSAKSLAAEHIKEMVEIAPREKRRPKRKGSVRLTKETPRMQSQS